MGIKTFQEKNQFNEALDAYFYFNIHSNKDDQPIEDWGDFLKKTYTLNNNFIPSQLLLEQYKSLPGCKDSQEIENIISTLKNNMNTKK